MWIPLHYMALAAEGLKFTYKWLIMSSVWEQGPHRYGDRLHHLNHDACCYMYLNHS
jgi:hypothetical protein